LYDGDVTTSPITNAPYVALLRGINVGGKNILPMKDLAAMFTGAGCSHVRTYIQSGNVIFTAGRALARRVPALIADTIAVRFGFRVPVVMLTADEFRDVARNHPLLAPDADVATLSVAFLADEPSPARVARLDASRSFPDVFMVRGRAIYLRCPNGVAKTKLTNTYFDSVLETTSTVRNWRTVLAVLEIVSTAPCVTRRGDV
jgi:uncharacterized protein (DUF1697 family)